jgi:hypothetical protein
MNLREYGHAVVLGFRSILDAARHWPNNPLTTTVNSRLWGGRRAIALAVLVVLTLLAEAALSRLGRFPSLGGALDFLAFVPELVRELFLSPPAWFAFVVAWRVRRLRRSDPGGWPQRATMPDFGLRFFDAGALPVAAAAVVIGFGAALVTTGSSLLGDHVSPSANGVAATMDWDTVAIPSQIVRSVLVIALVAGILAVHRSVRSGLGKLVGAGFFVWGIHIGIAFAVPWMISWWAYLPALGHFASQRSVDWAHLLFDLSVASVAWTAARESCRETPLWLETERPAASPPPPPPGSA